jgi:hypothetical protein
MKNPAEFEKRVNHSLNHMEAKLSFLNEGVKGLTEAFLEFREEISDFMAYSTEQQVEHERRIKRIEKELNIGD